MRGGLRRAALVLAAFAVAAGIATTRTAASAADSGPVGGVVLDGYGGIHPFGGFPLANVARPYWSGWDIARAVQVLPDGSGGWTLDGFGGVHAWGAAPATASTVYWPNWDIARAFYILPDRRSGYLLDGWGTIHAFGNAPTAFLSGAPWWPGWDIARGLDIHLSNGVADGGVELDAVGGMHYFGNYPREGSPTYFSGHSIYMQIHSVDSKQYAYKRWGIVDGIASGISPYWSGIPSWNGFDIARDVQLFGSNNPSWQPQPINPYDWNEFLAATAQPYDVGYRPECNVGPAPRWAAAQVIVVSIACQALTAYQNGGIVVSSLVTTGRPSAPTPRGWFHILNKRSPAWLLLNVTYGPAVKVQYTMSIDNRGDLFHDAPWEPASEYGQLSTLYTSHASHGCIHVLRPQLDTLYSWTRDGASVYIN